MSAVRVPAAAWALAWICLAGQVLALVLRGPSASDPSSVLVSVVLSALVVGWVSAGVVRARPGRFWFAAILFGLMAVLGVVSVVVQLPETDPGELLELGFSVAQLGALVALSRTAYFRALRADPSRAPDVAGLVLVAIVVGALGGLTAPSIGQDGPRQVQVRL